MLLEFLALEKSPSPSAIIPNRKYDSKYEETRKMTWEMDISIIKGTFGLKNK